ncbi:helix-turn-helix transcriptional regulator [Variovorax sp. PAMC 28711]|uniref:helix-turn-helix transcriptional regulator n=1 Tax=Variovorax sp. PAMC 28711 TaxID=1795631 RepID=UPI00078C9D7C|nr:helix-turn-helix transcriptional regulator [Variovorax sp. PAMC 28711]AMM26535.1 helix-turn-helix transcriptional regulator [Variovorax sp. PAMC 28711]
MPPDPATDSANALAGLVADAVPALGDPGFGAALLQSLRAALPVSSLSVYRIGVRPAICFSASLGVPDTTRECWNAYASGPILVDRTLRTGGEGAAANRTPLRLCHITALEVPPEHRARVYEAHGVAERVSVVCEEQGDTLFAVNLYRHVHARPLTDNQLADFGRLGAALMALARKHVSLSPAAGNASERLLALCPELSGRELEVCGRLLKGMTQEGIAADLGLSLPTVKTYRNRAFGRLGIHFRSELFALMLGKETPGPM